MVARRRRYPDGHLLDEDRLGKTIPQSCSVGTLTSTLYCLYRREGWLITRFLTIFHDAVRNSENLITPDVAVFIGVLLSDSRALNYWEMRQGGRRAPQVVFEICVQATWRSDINDEGKPQLYGRMGVREYFACDPNDPPVWETYAGGARVLGWRYGENGEGRPIVADERGWLWSEELDSYVGCEDLTVRLYDARGVRRPTVDEAAQQWRQKEATQQRADEERRKKEVAQQRADEERQRADHLAAILRAHGIIPE